MGETLLLLCSVCIVTGKFSLWASSEYDGGPSWSSEMAPRCQASNLPWAKLDLPGNVAIPTPHPRLCSV